MKATTNFGKAFSTAILDFMDKAPGVIPSILTLVIVAGFLLMG